MFDDVIGVLLSADSVIIPFEILRGTKDVCAIVAVCGQDLTSFNFEDEDAFSRSSLTSSDVRSALQSLGDHVVLKGPISVEALTGWTLTGGKPRVAVHHLTLCDPLGVRAELSRDGAVYAYSMSLSVTAT